MSEHEPDAPAAELQVPPVPSVTVTVPAGEPAPGASTDSVQLTVYGTPTGVGSGLSEVIVSVVEAALTVWVSALDVLPVTLPSPL